MAKLSSNLATWCGRFLKIVMVALVVPLAIGLVSSILEQLSLSSASGTTIRQWVEWGAMTYIGIHLLLYRPEPLFRASHRLFSTIAVWLFGGQVASVEQAAAGGKKGKEPKEPKGPTKSGKGQGASQGSTLVAFSPYVIPLYTVLVCAAGWGMSRLADRVFLDAPVAFAIGLTMTFHWLMTAEDLQEQRSRWHLETYLLAIGLVFALTLIIGGSCVPWAVPEFSFTRALADGCSRTQAIYTTLVRRLFF